MTKPVELKRQLNQYGCWSCNTWIVLLLRRVPRDEIKTLWTYPAKFLVALLRTSWLGRTRQQLNLRNEPFALTVAALSRIPSYFSSNLLYLTATFILLFWSLCRLVFGNIHWINSEISYVVLFSIYISLRKYSNNCRDQLWIHYACYMKQFEIWSPR